MDFPEHVNTSKKIGTKKKGARPRVNPAKFYPSQVEIQAQEILREELGEYAKKLQGASQDGGVQGVYGVLGAVPDWFREKAEKLAENVSTFQIRAFADYSNLVVGERYFPTQGDRDTILSTWTENFVNLCKSTNEEMRKKVAGVISDGVLSGRNIKAVTMDIQNTCKDFSRSKSELIATTEVGKLNTAISRNQSESSGIDYYEWSAAMDGRTRESHAVMDGKICKWGDDRNYYAWEDDPAKPGKRKLVRKPRPGNAYMGAPGTDFRCRCVALPYIPEYEDDYEEERPKGKVQGVTQERPAEAPPSERTLELERRLEMSRRADARHAARTDEQKAEILARWNERERKRRIAEAAERRHAERNEEAIRAEMQKRIETRKKARDLLSIMSGIDGIDTEKLRHAIESGNTARIESEMKPIAKARKEIEALGDRIDNPMEAAKKYGLSDLETAVKACESTLRKWDDLPLGERKKKLEFEIKWVTEKKKYATWELSRDIYRKELGKVETEIKWNEIEAQAKEIAELGKSLPKADAAFAKLMEAVEKAGKGDRHSNKDLEKYRKAVEKAQKKAENLQDKTEGASFDRSCFTDARKKKALWAKTVETADSALRGDVGKVWRAASKAEKDAVHGYTSSYCNVNEPLRGITYEGSKENKIRGEKRIPLITKFIGKSAIPTDMWAQRFDDALSLKKFGISMSKGESATNIYDRIKSLVGKEGTEGGFTSAGVAKGKGLDGRPIVYNIYMPKGTKAAYLEPVSSFGQGAKRAWDGKSKQSTFGSEAEILIQRGSKWKITKVNLGKYDGTYRCFIDVEIVEQKPLPFPYKKGFPY